MSEFRKAVSELADRSAYVMVGKQLIKTTDFNIHGDMVEATLDTPINNGSISRIAVHINNLILSKGD